MSKMSIGKNLDLFKHFLKIDHKLKIISPIMFYLGLNAHTFSVDQKPIRILSLSDIRSDKLISQK